MANKFQQSMNKGGPSDADMGSMPNVAATGLNTRPAINKIPNVAPTNTSDFSKQKTIINTVQSDMGTPSANTAPRLKPLRQTTPMPRNSGSTISEF